MAQHTLLRLRASECLYAMALTGWPLPYPAPVWNGCLRGLLARPSARLEWRIFLLSLT